MNSMNSMKHSQKIMRYLPSQYGYVGTAAPGWHDNCDLRYAIDPTARMKMRVIDYYVSGSRIDYREERAAAWTDAIANAPIRFHRITDETIPLPDRPSVRQSLADLIQVTIAGKWCAAGFRICATGSLNILLGYVHNHLNPDEPCKLYAVVSIIQPEEDIHLRFAPSDRRIVTEGRPLFYDVHVPSGYSFCDTVRVREYFLPEDGVRGHYDVNDVDFSGHGEAYVQVTRYKGVTAWPTIDASS